MAKNKKHKFKIVDDYVYVNPFEEIMKERQKEKIRKEYEQVLKNGNKKEIYEFVSKNSGFGIEQG